MCQSKDQIGGGLESRQGCKLRIAKMAQREYIPFLTVEINHYDIKQSSNNSSANTRARTIGMFRLQHISISTVGRMNAVDKVVVVVGLAVVVGVVSALVVVLAPVAHRHRGQAGDAGGAGGGQGQLQEQDILSKNT